MGNINTYLNWRGALDFTERPFCEADNLALAILSYLELGQIVSYDQDEISIQKAYEQYQALAIPHFTGDDSYRMMLQYMASSRRFGTAALSYYRTIFDESRSTQFAAIQIRLGDGSRYISFRGTDNSITGWEEDFRMGSEVVPAQREAVKYLNEIMDPKCSYRIGGHSKGGNLAIYASIHCREELSASILAVYNNDGPGLSSDIIPQEKFQRIDGRLHWIISEYSVIGTLFPYGAPTKIVGSSGEGLLQHNPFTWQIEGDTFLEKKELSKSCQFYVDIFDTWINTADLEHRRAFTQDLFGALKAGGAKTMGEVLGGGIDGFGTILLSIVNSESRTKIVIENFIKTFLAHCRAIDLRETFRSKAALHGGILLLAGILLMLFPGVALRLTGALAGGVAVFLLGRRILTCSVNNDMDARQKKFRILSCLAGIIVVEFLVVNKSMALISSHFILGVLLLLFAFRTIYRSAEKNRSIPERLLMCAASIDAMLLGLVAFTESEQESVLVFTLGTFFVAAGIVLLVRTIYRSGAQHIGTSRKF